MPTIEAATLRIVLGMGIVCAIAIIFFVMYRVLRSAYERRPLSFDEEDALPTPAKDVSVHSENTEQLVSVLRELIAEQRELSRHLTDVLEKKTIEVRRLLRDADKKIELLEQHSPRERVKPQVSVLQTEGTDRESTRSTTAQAREEREALLGVLRSPAPAGSQGLRELASEEKIRRVYELADSGMSIHRIAQQMSIGKGEIKLILSLRKGA